MTETISISSTAGQAHTANQAADPVERLRCRNAVCGKSFGGSVVFCPFCSAEQAHAATVVPDDEPVQPPGPEDETELKQPEEETPHEPPFKPPGPAVIVRPRGTFMRNAILLPLVLAAGWALVHVLQRRLGVAEPSLAPQSAEVMVISVPPADGPIDIDGQYAGEAGQPIRSPPGRHIVTLLAPGWKPASQLIQAAPGQSLRLRLLLQPNEGTDPHGAAAAAGAPDQQDPPPRQFDILAPPVGWSPPVNVSAGDAVKLTFHGRIHVRLDRRILSFEGDTTTLKVASASPLQIASIEDHAIRVALTIRSAARAN